MYKAYKLHVRNPFRIYQPVSWLCAIIRSFCKTYTNHISVLLIDETGEWLYQAVEKGVEKVPYKEWLNREYTIQFNKSDMLWMPNPRYKVYIPEEMPIRDEMHYREIKQRADLLRGRKYDFENTLIHQAIRIITAKWKGEEWWIGRTKDWSQDRVQCAETAALIFGEPDAYKARPYL